MKFKHPAWMWCIVGTLTTGCMVGVLMMYTSIGGDTRRIEPSADPEQVVDLEERSAARISLTSSTQEDFRPVTLSDDTAIEENISERMRDCEEMKWWHFSKGEALPLRCLQTFDDRYLDTGAAKYAFWGMNFGKPITFRRIFSDPIADRNRVLEALERSECWSNEGRWSQEQRRQDCHSESFVSYGISLVLCDSKELRKSVDDIRENWLQVRCRQKNELVDELEYSERLMGSSLAKLLSDYGQDENYSTYASLLLLAAYLGDETALGLITNSKHLADKQPWRQGWITLSFLSVHDSSTTPLSDLVKVQHSVSLQAALDVAVGLEELGVEPNWRNLVEVSRGWATSEESSYKEAMVELANKLTSANEVSSLRALRKMERVALDLELGLYD